MGNTVVEYTYDAWGKVLSVTGTLASTVGQINPFRYRGYYYDTETGWYYLQTRYYDPEVGRFINADGYVSTGQGIIGNNMFAYCGNNPVMHSDPSGNRYVEYDPDKDDNWLGKHRVYPPNHLFAKPKHIIYDVPLYNQGLSSLCWAFCQIMIESYRNEETLTGWQAFQKAIELSKSRFDSAWWIWEWNKPGHPENLQPLGNPDRIEDLYDLLVEYGPLYASYKSTGDVGHAIVVTGVDVDLNIVYTNNSWGVQGKQTLKAFKKGVVKSSWLDFGTFTLSGLYTF